MSIRIFDTPEMLYEAAATAVVRLANDAVAARGRFLLVLSGGQTPLPLFERLAQPVEPGIVGAPLFVRQRVDQAGIALHPDQ